MNANSFIEPPRVSLGYLRRRHATHAALDRAFAVFEYRHSEWANSLFDRHFVQQHIAPQLMNGTLLTPAGVADAWASQLRHEGSDTLRKYARAAQPISAAFLRILDLELRASNITSLVAIHGEMRVLQ